MRSQPAASREALRLIGSSSRELELLLIRGETPDPSALAGQTFRGLNRRGWADLARVRKFIKAFSGDGTTGWNRPTRQTSFTQPWIPTGPPFGHYTVRPVDPTSRDNAYLHALCLDYSINSALDPTRVLRDYLVRVGEDIYLGKAYVALGRTRIPVSYFVLDR